MTANPRPDVLLARYGELWLKGKNRHQFERRLLRNLQKALRPLDPETTVEREHGVLIVKPSERIEEIGRRLQQVFGLSSISPAHRVDRDPERIAEVGIAVVGGALEHFSSRRPVRFRVQTRRADKRYPLISMELDRIVADRVLAVHGERLQVDLTSPELVLGINVRTEHAFVFGTRLRGAGGLPVGTVGRVVSLFAGGIDSPVATWMAMKRGLEAVYCTFHSYPWVGADFRRKVERLVRCLAPYQPRSLLYAIPLTPIQEAVRDGAPSSYRTVLYRRSMQRLATRVAEREGASALVTGESLGQVASQTLENLTCIANATPLSVLRPLVAFDKEETIALAKRLGTYETSIEPVVDCCTVFQPKKPVLRAKEDVCAEVEARLPLEELEHEALERADRTVIGI